MTRRIRYTGAQLRKLRQTRGVGRPPKTLEEFKAFEAAKTSYRKGLEAKK